MRPPHRPPSAASSLLLAALLACGPADPKGAPGATDSAPGPDTAAPARGALRRVDLPSAPATMLLLTLTPEGVVVDDALAGDFFVDLDPVVGPDEAFRTRVLDAGGAELYRRDTPTPVLVRDFLAHYSGIAGVDILSLLPDLGAFHVFVPQLEGAAAVVFELRDARGGYAEVGRWDPARAPTARPAPPEVVVGSATLVESGPSDVMLDLTLIGDGYTADEQAKWQADAAALAERVRSAPPLSAFAGRINIHRVDAVSAESGASYDCIGACRFRDTAFRSVFAVNFINEISGTDYRSTTLFQLGQHELDRALAVVPTDLAIVVVNSEKSGGMSIHHAAASNGGATWTDTGVHELGHLLGLLGDEYTADECIRSPAMGLPRNITDAPDAPPWAHWVEAGTPLPTPEGEGFDEAVGAFSSAYNCPDLYRPVQTCRMKSASSAEFCPVCAEQLVLQLTRYTDLAAVTVVPGAEGDLIEIDALGLDHQLSTSTDGRSWTPATAPLRVTGDALYLQIVLQTPLVRSPAGLLTEQVHLRRDPPAE